MIKINKPVVYETEYSKDGLVDLENQEIFEYPSLYIIHSKNKNNITTYVGETNNINTRTKQHLVDDPKTREDWNSISEEVGSKMYVIGHEHFNKSMTLDLENQFILYLSGIESVGFLMNRRTNPQGKYYPKDEKEEIFSDIWNKLNEINPNLFPTKNEVVDSALFKASPFHELTKDQEVAQQLIIEKVKQSMEKSSLSKNFIIVEGEAGSGKTVLISSTFNEIIQKNKDLSAYLIVNHEQQLKVYTQIMEKLGIHNKNSREVVMKPTRFINTHGIEDKVDIVFIDEAHLLWTQGKQAYQGNNQLEDIISRAKVVVAVIGLNQVLGTTSYIDKEKYKQLSFEVKNQNNLIELKEQLRINSDSRTQQWISKFIHEGIVTGIPQHDSKGYEIKIFDNPDEMYSKIKEKAKDSSNGLSRMLATFDWEYKNVRKPGEPMYMVRIGNWELPWNLQLKLKNKNEKELAWAEQSQTIDEVGSTFTIQGFDLNYAGVIIGPSVKFRKGKVIFDKNGSKNKNAIQKRTLADNTKADLSQELLQNELNVLLTRGVHGLYVYAVDDELREELLRNQMDKMESLVAEEPLKYKK